MYPTPQQQSGYMTPQMPSMPTLTPNMNSILPLATPTPQMVASSNLFGMFGTGFPDMQQQSRNNLNTNAIAQLLTQLVTPHTIPQLPFANTLNSSLLSSSKQTPILPSPSLYHPSQSMPISMQQYSLPQQQSSQLQPPFRDRDRDRDRDSRDRDRGRGDSSDRDRGDRDRDRDRGDRGDRDRDYASSSRDARAPLKKSKALCRYFNTPKGCSYGDTCAFVHESNYRQ
jgi:hypothetical protein